MQSFQVNLPDDVYGALQSEAARSGRPATDVAGQVIERWLRARRRADRDKELSAFAAEYAGTAVDFDPELEAAAVEHLLETGRQEH
jgi:hypothetical protein